MTFEAYLVAAVAVVLTGISKSGFAGGLGILGVPLIALTMPPEEAAVLLLPILIGIDMLSVYRYRREWSGQVVLTLLPGALLGISLGMLGFALVNPALLQIGIGVMALGFVAQLLHARTSKLDRNAQSSRLTIVSASALSGFAGFVAHAGGPPIKGVLLRMGTGKGAFIGTNSVFFFVLNVAKAGGYGTLGLFSRDGLLQSASLAPFLLLGVWAGFKLHDRVSQRAFQNLAYGLLALAGLNLITFGTLDLLAASK